jgi:hypothetical protein
MLTPGVAPALHSRRLTPQLIRIMAKSDPSLLDGRRHARSTSPFGVARSAIGSVEESPLYS